MMNEVFERQPGQHMADFGSGMIVFFSPGYNIVGSN